MNRWPPGLYLSGAAERGIPLSDAKTSLSFARNVQSKGATAVLSLAHLSRMTGASYGFLRRVVIRHGQVAAYQQFAVKKRGKGGGFRQIFAPSDSLKAVQTFILQCILSVGDVHPSSFGFVKGVRSPILACASQHTSAQWLMHLDVKDFFPSVPEERVYQQFLAIGYRPLVAFELSRICTWPQEPAQHPGFSFEVPEDRQRCRPGTKWFNGPPRYKFYNSSRVGALPQGAPTSPMLANMVFRRFDSKLEELALSMGMVYTRYADDLFFSTSASTTRRDLLKLRELVRLELTSGGFRLNMEKARISPPGARKVVLGLLVDGQEARLTRRFKDNLRMHFFYLERDPIGHSKRRGFWSVWALFRHIEGLVSFAISIEPRFGEAASDMLRTLQSQVAGD